ncbi:Rrf2 family transcriptional regulator [Pontibacter sp. BT310]|jgi:Rrf2 family protein|uniref:Rrf2 family transcriptional regulator n=1 Tax=Pontibacter populi TaxID=890055 RepID=A0ABS6XAN1_9BACT|nr:MULTISPECIES: Rrf2 family transcriptional regulator [Pontibacter]MBJ6118195.1 Rrf2 family transcriptional regulator [Pontibacter sp. BT310]MBR0570622.1 Rrf2 family transcriptional regulator [Microvirga sp. STS03]MBW3365048.1 Rrf2 family transcriptional regulator [Pontibacter populi]
MLSKKTKYAFHALSYLAENQEKGAILIQEIAAAKKISQKFLESILLDLKKAGVLGSKKGKGGGYYLIKKPEEITLAKVIRLLNGPIAWLPCVSLNYYEKCGDCPDEATCNMHLIMCEVRDQTLRIVENKTVQDLVGSKQL